MIEKISGWIYIPIIIFGLIGNFLAFIVFSRKKFHNTSSYVYLRFQCLNDSFVLIISLPELLNIFFGINLEFYQFYCKINLYLAYSTITVSNWLLVIISIDRYLTIRYPTKFTFKNKHKYQLLVSIMIILCNFIINIPMIIFRDLKQTIAFDNLTNLTFIDSKCVNDIKLVWFDLFTLSNGVLFPFLCMILPTCLTIRYLFKTRRSSGVYSTNRTIKLKDRQFAITSVSINILFLLFRLPFYIFFILNIYFIKDDYFIYLFYYITSILCYFFFTIIFLINFKFNLIFRNEFFKLIGLKPNSNNNAETRQYLTNSKWSTNQIDLNKRFLQNESN